MSDKSDLEQILEEMLACEKLNLHSAQTMLAAVDYYINKLTSSDDTIDDDEAKMMRRAIKDLRAASRQISDIMAIKRHETSLFELANAGKLSRTGYKELIGMVQGHGRQLYRICDLESDALAILTILECRL